MSFSGEYKQEILSKRYGTDGENIAFVAGVTAVAGALKIDEHKKYSIEITSDRYDVTAAVNDALFSVYGGNYEINIATYENNEKEFAILLGSDNFVKAASDIGYITYENGKIIPTSGGITVKLDGEKEIKAYITGITAVTASVTVPQKNADGSYSGGYHFEMQFSDKKLLTDVARLLKSYGIAVKTIERSGEYALYIKDSETIGDMLAFTGANNAVLELYNIIGIKELRNNVNRAQNCNIANIDKTVNAGQKQLAAIAKIESTIGINALPEKLREPALLRRENPSLSLDELSALMSEPIGKSGMNHRLRKIVEIAAELDGKAEGENG